MLLQEGSWPDCLTWPRVKGTMAEGGPGCRPPSEPLPNPDENTSRQRPAMRGFSISLAPLYFCLQSCAFTMAVPTARRMIPRHRRNTLAGSVPVPLTTRTLEGAHGAGAVACQQRRSCRALQSCRQLVHTPLLRRERRNPAVQARYICQEPHLVCVQRTHDPQCGRWHGARVTLTPRG